MPVSCLGKLAQILLDVSLVPGQQDRVDVGEVLVQGRAADPALLGDVRHLDRGQPYLVDQRPGGVQDRRSYVLPMLVDRLAPQPRHASSVRPVAASTLGRVSDELTLA